MSIQLKNLKASFIFKENLLPKEKQSAKKVIFKLQQMTFTIYKHTPTLLNVTGIKSLKQLEMCKEMMEKHFDQTIVEVRIDNTFFMKKNKLKINLNKIHKNIKLNHNDIYIPSYNPELFAGMHIRPKDKIFPFVILFSSGTFILMGGKCLDRIHEAVKIVNNLLNEYETNLI